MPVSEPHLLCLHLLTLILKRYVLTSGQSSILSRHHLICHICHFQAATTLNYPLIVKHYNGYSSIGMTKDSRCPNAEQLRVQARKMIDAFGGALIEVKQEEKNNPTPIKEKKRKKKRQEKRRREARKEEKAERKQKRSNRRESEKHMGIRREIRREVEGTEANRVRIYTFKEKLISYSRNSLTATSSLFSLARIPPILVSRSRILLWSAPSRLASRSNILI